MKKKNIIIVCIFVLILIFTLIIVVSISPKKEEVQESIPKNETTEGIDSAEEINEPNETIQAELVIDNKSDEAIEAFKGYRLATDIDQANYQITNVEKSIDSKKTTITGKIKNNGASPNLVLKVEFRGTVKSSSSIEIKDLKVGKTDNFEIKVLNNATSDEYTVYVEYVGE